MRSDSVLTLVSASEAPLLVAAAATALFLARRAMSRARDDAIMVSNPLTVVKHRKFQ